MEVRLFTGSRMGEIFQYKHRLVVLMQVKPFSDFKATGFLEGDLINRNWPSNTGHEQILINPKLPSSLEEVLIDKEQTI